MTETPAAGPQVLQAKSLDFRLSYSTITTHRRCPQAWVYQHMMGLVPDTELSPTDLVRRDLGSWWHAVRAADTLRRGTQQGTLLAYPEELKTGDGNPVFQVMPDAFGMETGVFLQIKGAAENLLPCTSHTIIVVSQVWWNKTSEAMREAWLEVMGDTLPGTLARMETRWQKTWGKDVANEEPLFVELRGSRPIPGVDVAWDESKSIPPPVLQGQIDEVYRDKRRNLVVVRDSKSMGDLPTTSALNNLLDSQTHLYAWIVEPELEKFGLRPQAVAYDRARTKTPTIPTVTQTGTLSKSITDYDLDTYLSWSKDGVPWGKPDEFYVTGAKKGQPKFGVYQAEESVIEHLSTPAAVSKWNLRSMTPLNRHILDAHLDAAAQTYNDMWATMVRVESGRQAGRNLSKNCTWCDYMSLCLAQMMGGKEGEYSLNEHGLKMSIDTLKTTSVG